jgi:hypothetical protein
VGDAEVSPEEEAEIEKQMGQLAADPEPTVSTALRWGRSQLDIIRRAASLAGIPYQTYLKEVAFRGALQDLKAAREAGIELPKANTPEGPADPGEVTSNVGGEARHATGGGPLFHPNRLDVSRK